jgi:hypothetical protein
MSMQDVIDLVAIIVVAVILSAGLVVLAIAWRERPAGRKGGKR